VTGKTYTQSVDQYQFHPSDSLGVFVKSYKDGKLDSLLVLSGKQKIGMLKKGIRPSPSFFETRDGGIWMLIKNTRYLYYYDVKKGNWISQSYTEGTKLLGHIATSESDHIQGVTDKMLSVRDWIVYMKGDKLVTEGLGTLFELNKVSVEAAIPGTLLDKYQRIYINIGKRTLVHEEDALTERRFYPLCFSLDAVREELAYKNIAGSGVYSYDPKKSTYPNALTSGDTVCNMFSASSYDDLFKHEFRLFNMKSEEIQTVQLIDRSARLQALYYDENARVLFVRSADKYIVLPLQAKYEELFKSPSSGTIYNYSMIGSEFNLTTSNGKPYVFRTIPHFISDEGQTFIVSKDIELFQPVNKKFELSQTIRNNLYTLNRLNAGSFSNIIVFRLVNGIDLIDLISVNVDNGEQELIATLSGTDNTLIPTHGYAKIMIVNDITLGYSLYEKFTNDLPYQVTEYGSLDKLNAVFNSLLAPYNSDGQMLFEAISNNFILLNDGRLLYFPPDYNWFIDGTTGRIQHDEINMMVSEITLASKDHPRVDKTAIKRNKNRTIVEIPAFLYDPKTGVLQFKPDWVGLHYVNDKPYIRHVSKDADGVLTYQTSLLLGWKLANNPKDPLTALKFPITQISKSVRRVHVAQNSIIYKSDDSKLSVAGALGNPVIDATELIKRYGEFMHYVEWADDLWLRFQSGIVRYIQSGDTFPVLTLSDGINLSERSDIAVDTALDRLLLTTDDGIYGISRPSTSAKLDIPWIENNDQRIPSSDFARINFNKRDLRIPVNILRSSDSRRFKIKYQLIGYDKEARLRQWTPQLEYKRLPAGKYTLSVVAYSPDGVATEKLEIPIRILPPIWDTWWARLIYAIAIFFSLRAIMRWRLKRLERRNKMLEQAVSERTIELSEKQRRMTESIQYASLIQRSILPQTAQLNELFSSHFVIWKPRDIVGGDFYWLHHKPETQRWLFAVIDCTGHGVPGALITMTVNSILNHLVTDQGIEAPVTLLKELHSQLGAALHQEEDRTQQDGLEISMIAVDKSKSELEFAGAGLHLIHWHPELEGPELIRGYKHGLGGLKRYKQLDLSSSVVSYRQDSIFYMYTDGIIDQPRTNDERRIRFGHPQWLEFINRVAVYDLMRQQERFEGKLESLLEIHEQRDDITVVGMRM